MHEASSDAESERAALVKPGGTVVGFPGRRPVCGAPLRSHQRTAWSDPCRAAKSRRNRLARLAGRDQRICALLEGALRFMGRGDKT